MQSLTGDRQTADAVMYTAVNKMRVGRHGDHVGGLVDTGGTAEFPNATIHVSAPEWDYLRGMDENAASSLGLANHAALVTAMQSKVDAFAPGSELVPGVVKAVEIKGHTPGHSGYLIGSGADALLKTWVDALLT